MTDDSGVWVYGVADTIAPAWLSGVDGVGGGRVRTVDAAGLAAAVTAVSLADFGEQALRRHLEDLAWLESTARLHHHVIEVVASHAPVVPLRLATVYRDSDGVAAMLTRQREDLAAALARVRARTEWGVKAYAGGDPAAVTAAGDAPAAVPGRGAAAAAAAPGQAATGPGAAYLRRRRSQLDAGEQARRTAAASAEQIHASLSSLAAAADLRAPQDPQLSGHPGRMILNGTYLVDDDRTAQFTAAVRRLAGQHETVRMELTGPWPPYSFALVGADDRRDAPGPGGDG